MNIRPLGTDLFHAEKQRETDGRTDGQTDATEPLVTFRYFAIAPTELGCLKPEASPFSVLVKGRHLRSFKCCCTDNKHLIL